MTNNPEFKIIYKDDEIEKILDGVYKDKDYVRKTLKEVNELIAKFEILDPEMSKLLKR